MTDRRNVKFCERFLQNFSCSATVLVHVRPYLCTRQSPLLVVPVRKWGSRSRCGLTVKCTICMTKLSDAHIILHHSESSFCGHFSFVNSINLRNSSTAQAVHLHFVQFRCRQTSEEAKLSVRFVLRGSHVFSSLRDSSTVFIKMGIVVPLYRSPPSSASLSTETSDFNFFFLAWLQRKCNRKSQNAGDGWKVVNLKAHLFQLVLELFSRRECVYVGVNLIATRWRHSSSTYRLLQLSS